MAQGAAIQIATLAVSGKLPFTSSRKENQIALQTRISAPAYCYQLYSNFPQEWTRANSDLTSLPSLPVVQWRWQLHICSFHKCHSRYWDHSHDNQKEGHQVGKAEHGGDLALFGGGEWCLWYLSKTARLEESSDHILLGASIKLIMRHLWYPKRAEDGSLVWLGAGLGKTLNSWDSTRNLNIVTIL